jgi:hypothetical protein
LSGAPNDNAETLLAEIGRRDLPNEHFAQWRSAQQSLTAALARLPRDLAWSDEADHRQT